MDACQGILGRMPLWWKRYKVDSVLDLGCGDWNWMRWLDWTGKEYDGYDVVRDLILSNAEKYGTTNIRFRHGDVTQAQLKTVDLVIAKDLLQHLTTEMALGLLRSVLHSRSRYLAATTAVGWPAQKRESLSIGGFSPIDLTAPPFNLGEPEDFIIVPRKEGNPQKLFAIWRLDRPVGL